MEIYYENNSNQKIKFDEFPIVIQKPETLFDASWSYLSESGNGRNVITGFYKEMSEKNFTLSIFADTKDEYDLVMNNLHRITEKDVLDKKPGRLFVNGYYLECYIVQKSFSDYEELFFSVEVKLNIVSENPFWIKKAEYYFDASKSLSTDNKKYNYKYAYRYANGMRNRFITNNYINECNFELKIFGAALKPQIIIGGYEYLINDYLEEGEYLIVDSLKRTVIKVMHNGTIVNIFDSREKKKSVFQKIQPGRNLISWSGKFDFMITLYEERAEPEWH